MTQKDRQLKALAQMQSEMEAQRKQREALRPTRIAVAVHSALRYMQREYANKS